MWAQERAVRVDPQRVYPIIDIVDPNLTNPLTESDEASFV
jgi:hypothetical protein